MMNSGDGAPRMDSVPLSRLVPDNWFGEKSQSSVWLSVFQIFRVAPENFVNDLLSIDLGSIRAILMYGSLSLPSMSLEFKVSGGQLEINSKLEEASLPLAVYLMLVAPFTVDGRPGNEPIIKEKCSSAVGLLVAINGRNMAYKHVHEAVVHLGSGYIETSSNVIENPFYFPEPDIADERLDLIGQLARTIEGLSEPDRNCVNLSLRWFEQGSYTSGVDSYLSYWIALETLSMYGTNIKPVNDLLAQAYGVSYQEASARFHIGRLFGLRGRIVHEGARVAVHSGILQYISAVYVDCLLQKLEFDCLGKTVAVLESGEFNYSLIPST